MTDIMIGVGNLILVTLAARRSNFALE